LGSPRREKIARHLLDIRVYKWQEALYARLPPIFSLIKVAA
jgi:hypothetical protein